MHRIIYSSIAAVTLDEAELEALLGPSRARNEADGVTGVLVHVVTPHPDVSGYVQLLEGEPETVAATYRRIRADELHDEHAVLVDEPAAARLAAGWSMRFARLDGNLLEDTGTEPLPEDAPAGAHRARLLAAVRRADRVRDLVERCAA